MALAAGLGTAGETPLIAPFSRGEPGRVLPSGWEPLTFSAIDRHTDYSLVRDGDAVVVRAESDASASGILYAIDVDPREYPIIEWRWRVANVLEHGDVSRKSGDDYPARLYVTFQYDPERAGWTERMRYEALRLLYGAYPPVASLNYLFASRAPVGTVARNAYTERNRMIVVESGGAHVGEWRSERRNIVDDYRRAFGDDVAVVPRISGVALMTDTDDTGESAIAWFGDVTLVPQQTDDATEPERDD